MRWMLIWKSCQSVPSSVYSGRVWWEAGSVSNKQDHFDLIDGRAANSEERTQVMRKPGQSGQGGVGQLEQPAKRKWWSWIFWFWWLMAALLRKVGESRWSEHDTSGRSSSGISKWVKCNLSSILIARQHPWRWKCNRPIVNLQQFQILGSAINMESFEIFASHFIGRLNPRISLVFNFSRDVVKVK